MRGVITILILLIAIYFVSGLEIIGSFLGVNGVKGDQFAVWNFTTHSFVPQYHLESKFTGTIHVHKPTGDVYYLEQFDNVIRFWNKTTIMRFVPQLFNS